MIRTGAQYIDSSRHRRVVYVNWACDKDVATPPPFKPLVEVRARSYDMQHETSDTMTIEPDELKFTQSRERRQKCQSKK
jgi:4-hydroxyphenylacetate 3-monooxygenase